VKKKLAALAASQKKIRQNERESVRFGVRSHQTLPLPLPKPLGPRTTNRLFPL
jgi:hypothetical protein